MVKRLVIASLVTTTHTLHTGLSAIFGDGHIEWWKHHCVLMSFPIFVHMYIFNFIDDTSCSCQTVKQWKHLVYVLLVFLES